MPNPTTPSSRPSAKRGLVDSGILVLAIGLIVALARWAAGRYENLIRDHADFLTGALDATLQWGWPAAGIIVAIAVLLIVSPRFTASRDSGDRVRAIVAQGLRSRPETVRCRVRWTGFGRKRRPRRIVISYQPGTVDQQLADGLAVHLSTHWPAHYTTTWLPHRDKLTAEESPPPEPPAQGQDTGLDPVETDPLGRARQVTQAHFGTTAEITATAVDEAGEPLAIAVRYPQTTRVATEYARARIGEEISHRLPGGTRSWVPSWDLQQDTLTLRRRPPLPKHVLHPMVDHDETWNPNGLVLPYATDGYGRAIGWDLNAATPHALVVGPTGTGKTVTLRAIATEAPRKGCEVWIADPKRIEMKGLRGWPGITRVCTTISDIVAMLGDAHTLMDARYEALERNEVLTEDLTPLVIVLDEHLIFWAGANRLWKQEGGKGTHPVLDQLLNLIVLARSSRIHLCFGVQRPDAELFKSGGRDSVRHRVSLGKLSPEGALMMWNDARTGTGIDMTVRGRATATTSTGEPEEVQTWWTPDPDPHRLERNPKSLSAEELTRLQELHAAATAAQQARTPDDLAAMREILQEEDAASPDENPDKNAVPDDVETATRAADLSPGDRVIIEIDGADVHATINTIEVDDDAVTIDFTTVAGSTEVLELEPREILMTLKPPNAEAA